MAYELNKEKVNRVCSTALREFGGGSLTHGEVIVGLAEAIGRVIVDSCHTYITMGEAVNVVHDHLKRTIVAGARAKGFGLENEDGT